MRRQAVQCMHTLADVLALDICFAPFAVPFHLSMKRNKGLPRSKQARPAREALFSYTAVAAVDADQRDLKL